MADCCLIKKVATVEVYENKNEVRAYGFMAGDRNTPVMEVRFKHLWGESNLSNCKLRWIIVDDVGSLLVGEVPIQSDNTALINLPNELFTGDRRMKVQLTVASCDGERILNLQQFTDLKVINSLAPNEVVEPVYQILINAIYDESQKYLKELETSYTQKYGSLDSLYKSARASLEQYLITAENGGNAEFLQGYSPAHFQKVENTINDLIVSTKYNVGDVVQVLGYYSAGDGAGHKRQKKPSGYSGADAVIGADGSIWGIVHSGEVNVSWFGAKGDGINDDTIAIQKAIDFCDVIGLNDKHLITSTITVDSNSYSGQIGKVIKGTNTEITKTTQGVAFLSKGFGNLFYSMNIFGNNTGSGIIIGDITKASAETVVDKVIFKNCVIGLDVYWGNGGTINASSYFCKKGFLFSEQHAIDIGSTITGASDNSKYKIDLKCVGDFSNSSTDMGIDVGRYTIELTGNVSLEGFSNSSAIQNTIKGNYHNINIYGEILSKISASCECSLLNLLDGFGNSTITDYRTTSKITRNVGGSIFESENGTFGKPIFYNYTIPAGETFFYASGYGTERYVNISQANASEWVNCRADFIPNFGIDNFACFVRMAFNGIIRLHEDLVSQGYKFKNVKTNEVTSSVNNTYDKTKHFYIVLDRINKFVYIDIISDVSRSMLLNLDTPYHATQMASLGILDSYYDYLTELHEYEKTQNVQSDSEIMALNVLQPPVIPTEVEAYAKEYNLI